MMESLAFAGFGLACLALYAGAKALDDRDRGERPIASPPSSADHTISFVSGDKPNRPSDRPLERDSRPSGPPRG